MLQCCITPLCNFSENSREDQANQIRHFATASIAILQAKGVWPEGTIAGPATLLGQDPDFF